jgi:hypothetical protein
LAVSAGQRDCLVTILEVTDETAPSGYPAEAVDVETALPSVYMAKTRELRSDLNAERYAGDQMTARTYTKWTMPYRRDMDPDRVDVPKTKRLRYLGRDYDIIDAEQTVRGREIVLTTLSSSLVTNT